MFAYNNNYLNNKCIFILESLVAATTNKLVGDLEALITANETNNQSLQKTIQMTNPYSIKGMTPFIIDIFINSPYGDLESYSALSSLLAIAKSKNMLVRTTVMNIAGKMNSLLAVQGTPGLRIMYENAYHYMPFKDNENKNIGFINAKSEKNIKDEIAFELTPDEYANFIHCYKHNTNKRTTASINKLFKNEIIDASDSLKHGLCDWILCNNGSLIHR